MIYPSCWRWTARDGPWVARPWRRGWVSRTGPRWDRDQGDCTAEAAEAGSAAAAAAAAAGTTIKHEEMKRIDLIE